MLNCVQYNNFCMTFNIVPEMGIINKLGVLNTYFLLVTMILLNQERLRNVAQTAKLAPSNGNRVT